MALGGQVRAGRRAAADGLSQPPAHLIERSDLVRDLDACSQAELYRPGRPSERNAFEMEASSVLSDLAALTPPFLVAAAFLIAVGAFVRHELRAAKKQPTEQGDEVDERSSSDQIGDRGPGSSH